MYQIKDKGIFIIHYSLFLVHYSLFIIMRLLLDDKVSGHNLNANEACIFAAIIKCTRTGKGWYGNYRELASAMPFVMSRQTASRAVEKLLTLGLIEVRENETLFAVQNGHEDVQIGRDDDQNGREDVQIGLPPNNPPIYNNMNEKEKEQQRALCTHDCEEQESSLFNKFWKDFSKAMPSEFKNRKAATKVAFEQRSEAAQKALVEAAKEGAPGHPDDQPNPYFFVVDFPEPRPVFLRGDEEGDIVQVKYGDKYKLVYRSDMELFGLEWVMDWN